MANGPGFRGGRWGRRVRTAAGALLVVGALAVRGADASDAGKEIDIRNFTFLPATVEVRAGSAVTWVNDDEEIHSILSSEGLFTSPALDEAGRFTYRFEKPGTYEYRCALHPQMKGTVVVR